MDTETIPIHRLIANFMAATTLIEKYLHEGRPLTALEFDSISLTTSGLQTFLDTWKRKKDLEPPIS